MHRVYLASPKGSPNDHGKLTQVPLFIPEKIIHVAQIARGVAALTHS